MPVETTTFVCLECSTVYHVVSSRIFPVAPQVCFMCKQESVRRISSLTEVR